MIQEKKQKQRRKMKKKEQHKKKNKIPSSRPMLYIQFAKTKKKCLAANVIDDPLTEVQD